MGWFAKKHSLFGLDISEQKITMIEVERSGGGHKIKNFGEISLPQGYIEGNIILNEQGVIDSLSQLASSIKAGSAKVAVAVSGDNVIARNLVVPLMPDHELAEAIRFETEAQIPVPGNQVTIDFIKYKPNGDDKIKRQDILSVAVKNEIIDRLVRIISSAGLQPVIMDIEPLAMLRAVELLNPSEIPGDSSFAIVGIGLSATNISVFSGEQMFFTRTLGFGVHKLSQGLAAYYNIPFEEAEIALRQAAIASEAADAKDAVDSTDTVDSAETGQGQTNEILLPKINGLIKEVRRSMDYYISQHPGERIQQIFVTGMGALVRGITEYMNSEVGYPVTVFNPVEHIQIASKLREDENIIRENGPVLTKVVGLALSEVV